MEDTVTILALNAEELSRAWRVSSAGDLNLPMLGRVRAAGKTVGQLEKDLFERMKKYFKDPQLTMYVSEYRSQPVSVVGAVERPGTYQLQGPKTIFDAILMAGGPKETGPTVTLSRSIRNGPLDYPGVRVDPDQDLRSLELNATDVMQGKGPAAEIRLVAGDVVTVSTIKERKLVHIAGEVIHPGSVELATRDSISLMKVLAMAGGLTKTASIGKVMISRADQPGGEVGTTFVNLKKIMNGQAKDLELSPGHIVIIPSNSLMTVVQSASTSAVNTGILLLGRF
ncbi:MAG: SLBB domain-containing protein [Bryobacterales bacterium]|nr:SLBB domain-containing protein [Bryobacterales bacterium]